MPKTPLQSFSEVDDRLGASCSACSPSWPPRRRLLAGCGSSSTTTASTATVAAFRPCPPRRRRRRRQLRQPGRSGPTSTVTWSPHSTGPVSRRQPPGDGTGSPGNGDPTVDFLYGPNNQQAYAFGGPTTATLDEFVAASRAANHAARSCPEVPAATASVTIDGETAIVDEVNCGVFALSATVIHAGRVVCVLHVRSAGQGSRDAGVVRVVDPSRCVREVVPLPTSGDATSRSSWA